MNPRFPQLQGALVVSLLGFIAAPSHAQSASSALPAASSTTGVDAASTSDPALADYARVRALYQKAAHAFEGGHYTDARELLLQAWSLRRSYDVAASLGDTEVKLGLFPEAAEHLSFSLRNFPPLENEHAIANVRSQLEAARKVAAGLRISVDEPQVEVRVDGRLIGMSPIADTAFVTPGRHTVEARKGSATRTQTLVGEAGVEKLVTLRLGSPEVASSTPPITDEPGRRSVVPLIVGGAAVAVGLTAGIAFRLSANANDEHADGIRNRLGAGGCVGAAMRSTDCVALGDDVDDKKRSTTLSTTGFVLAGVGLVAAPIWYLLSPRHQRGMELSAFVTPSFGVVSAFGRF
jgi:hypothetical protein